MTKECIGTWVDDHREEIIRDIMELVDIKSEAEPGDEEHPYGAGAYRALKYMERKGEELQLSVVNYDNHCATISLGTQEKTIGLFSHLDVVPGGDNWLLEPYHTTRTSQFLIGRGVQDNKGPAVAAFYLLRFFKEMGIPLRHRLIQFLGCDEESGMKDIEYYLSKETPPELSIVPDMRFPICYAEKGILVFQLVRELTDTAVTEFHAGTADNVIPDGCRLRIRVPGETYKGRELKGCEHTWEDGTLILETKGFSGHAAAPVAGVSAISKMAELVKAYGISADPVFDHIQEFARECDGACFSIKSANEELGDLTCALTVLRLEGSRLTLTFNIRYPAVDKGEDIIRKLEFYAKENKFGFHIVSFSEGFCLPKSHPCVDIFQEVYADWTGIMAEPFTSAGGTYARKLPNAFGAGLGLFKVPNPIDRIFCPGHGGGHQPDEALNLEHLFLGLKILIDAVMRVDAHGFSNREDNRQCP